MSRPMPRRSRASSRSRDADALLAPALFTRLLLAGLVLAQGGLWACGPSGPERTDLPSPIAGFQDSDQGSVSWWVQEFGEARPGDPLAERAAEVFDRLREAIAIRADLTVVGPAGAPYAVALPDDHVVLTRDALDLCYRGAPAEAGDARLAFVVGHELTHLDRGHFWHARAFTAMLRTEGEDDDLDALLEYLDRDADDVRRD